MKYPWVNKNKFLSNHLKYVYMTESPVIMHLWSALVAAGGAMGRHTHLHRGIGDVYANIFCLLVGPPGTRKNKAINCAIKLMKKSTNVKFAPDDTGGQRQGLIAAMADSEGDHIQSQLNAGVTGINLFENENIEDIGNLQISAYKNDPDKHTLFICATEFGSFLGQGSLEMTRFLIKMWDGEDYDYKIKKERCTLKDASLTILGGTTSSDLASLLPAEAIGQGFMSRIVLVYSAQREKSVPPSQAFIDKKYEEDLCEVYRYLYHEHRCTMTMTKGAEKIEDEIYNQNIQIPDNRFIYYSTRRHAQLEKLGMIIAATNQRATIEQVDFDLAHEILLETEKDMPEALGMYGLSPLAVAKQKLVDFIQHANGPVRGEILWQMMQRDMRMIDFKNSLSELLNANKILKVDTEYGAAFVYKEPTSEVDNILIANK